MFRTQNRPSSPTPFHLRQRQSRHQEPPFQPSFAFSRQGPNLESKYGTNYEPRTETLDLSIHMAPQPYSNRFSPLAIATPPPEAVQGRDFHVPARYRRSRNSRGTKEAKRRRDARRSRRKLAAQILDDQLSRDFDHIIRQANYGLPTPPSSVPSPAPTMPTTSVSMPAPTYLPPLPPAPPQLPTLDFSTFDINGFPEIPSGFRTPIPTCHMLPSWCPALPCLTRNGIWSDGLPVFYDLSSLPEPKEPEKPVIHKQELNACKELQLWRSNLDLKPKQSRFFPAQPSPTKPKVKLPPIACKLHRLETDLLDPLSAQPPSYADIVKTGVSADAKQLISELEAEKVEPAITAPVLEPSEDVKPVCTIPVLEPSAANLWHILTTGAPSKETSAADPYLASFGTSDVVDPYLDAWQAYIDEMAGSFGPAELDGREIPYVHANSLAGVANDLAMSPYAEEHPSLHDSAVCFTPLSSPPVGLNELLVDHEVNEPSSVVISEDLQVRYPTPSSISHTFVVADILPVDCVVGVDDEDDETVLAKSDAHFMSEQELFALPPLPESPERSTVDVATFLKMGHAKDCWCNDCDAEVESVATPKPVDTPELIAFDRLEELDDDWMLYSAADEQSLVSPASTAVSEDEKADTPVRWDAFFPPTPAWTAVMGKDGDEDSGVHGSSDWDWTWDAEF